MPKKWIISIGAIGAIVSSTFAVVSCGNKTVTNNGEKPEAPKDSKTNNGDSSTDDTNNHPTADDNSGEETTESSNELVELENTYFDFQSQDGSLEQTHNLLKVNSEWRDTFSSEGQVVKYFKGPEEPTDNSQYSENELENLAMTDIVWVKLFDESGKQLSNALKIDLSTQDYYIISPNVENHEILESQFKDKIFPANARIPETITKIGGGAFENVILPDGFKLPEKIREIGIKDSETIMTGIGAFYGATVPASLVIPQTLLEGDNRGMSNLFGNTTFKQGWQIPESVTAIWDNAFKGCHFSEGFVLGDNVTNIGSGSFDRAVFSTGFTISNHITRITSMAFAGATLPIGFTIPAEIPASGIARRAFAQTIPPHATYAWFDQNGVIQPDNNAERATSGWSIKARP